MYAPTAEQAEADRRIAFETKTPHGGCETEQTGGWVYVTPVG
jgi:hypothetical protein